MTSLTKIYGPIVCCLIFIIINTIHSAEVDNFTNRYKILNNPRQFDLTDELNSEVNRRIERAMKQYNAKVRSGKASGCDFKQEDGLSPIYSYVRAELNTMPLSMMETLVVKGKKFKNKSMGPMTMKNSIYRHMDFASAPIAHFHGLSPSFTVKDKQGNRHLLGTDKLSHFFSISAIYHREFAKQRNGKSVSYKQVMDWGRKSERTVFGYHSGGVYSPADLAANTEGMKFWTLLTKKYLKCGPNGQYTKKEPFKFEDFVGPHFDEGINCSKTRIKTKEATFKKAIRALKKMGKLIGPMIPYAQLSDMIKIQEQYQKTVEGEIQKALAKSKKQRRVYNNNNAQNVETRKTCPLSFDKCKEIAKKKCSIHFISDKCKKLIIQKLQLDKVTKNEKDPEKLLLKENLIDKKCDLDNENFLNYQDKIKDPTLKGTLTAPSCIGGKMISPTAAAISTSISDKGVKKLVKFADKFNKFMSNKKNRVVRIGKSIVWRTKRTFRRLRDRLFGRKKKRKRKRRARKIYTLVVKFPKLKVKNKKWDFGWGRRKKADPFIKVTSQDRKKQFSTQIRYNEHYTGWRNDHKLKLYGKSLVYFKVYDKDIARNDLIGSKQIVVNPAKFNQENPRKKYRFEDFSGIIDLQIVISKQ